MRHIVWNADVCSSDLGGEGEQVPVTVSLALGGTWPRRFAFAQYANRRLLRHLLLQELDFDLRGVLSPQDYETISPEQAKHAFIRRATEFLATRMAAMRSFSEASHRPDSRPSFSLLRIRSEEHTSELQSLMRISYAVFCLKKK